ncbi:hypothetical protein PHET_10265 [Paragonimus heterotremus]|uniref:Uncharacterized protein n=1 Tax=Paragonimus heterotremus TaxID=100268 RepID=A0A8J4T733_9TREM|nr:hypothetical protein PHET_10265 [Paragonimus heterotremus]
MTDYEDAMRNIEAENNALNHGDTRDGGDEHDLEDVGKLFYEPNSSDSEQKTTVDLTDVKESHELNMTTGEICNISTGITKSCMRFDGLFQDRP